MDKRNAELVAALEAALAYARAAEAWEARVIEEPLCWGRLFEPALTQALRDEMIELQNQRNALLPRLEAALAGGKG